MTSDTTEVTRCDVLVVGVGVAGMTAALEAAQGSRSNTRILLVSVTAVDGSSSDRAQGGIAAALDEDDTPRLHAADTLVAGRGLCRPSAVEVLVEEGARWVEELGRLGVPFEHEASLEGGHGRRRIHSVGGARTGRALSVVAFRRVMAEPRIELSTGERVLSLWVVDGRCVGVRTDRRRIAARATVLATGGYAALYRPTTNPAGSRGDGLMLAWRAGAALADLEMVQFHPTALAGGMLLSEALRGDGALLINKQGERFTNELAPRDEVARAIAAQGGAMLDLRPIDREKFPDLMAALEQLGYDPGSRPVPVSPAAHYTMGGIVTDLAGRTNVERLYAAGEVACTGVHGANRLASNSLLECVVFGARAGRAAVAEQPLPTSLPHVEDVTELDPVTDEVRDELWRHAGLSRDAEGLRALRHVPHTVARLIGEAALLRTESRGAHYRRDYPEEEPDLAGHFVFQQGLVPVLERWD